MSSRTEWRAHEVVGKCIRILAVSRGIRTNNVQDRMNGGIKHRSRLSRCPERPGHAVPGGAGCAERDEGWSSRRYISPESIERLSKPIKAEPAEIKTSHRRGPMIVETAIELARRERRAA